MSIQLTAVKVVGDYGSSVEKHPDAQIPNRETIITVGDSRVDTDSSLRGYDTTEHIGVTNDAYVQDTTTDIDEVRQD
jgi:hypothetical protein